MGEHVVQNILLTKFCQKIVFPEILGQKMFVQKSFCVKQFLIQKNFGQNSNLEIISSKNILGVCVCLSLHPLGRAHSIWRFLGPQLGLNFFEFELKPTGKVKKFVL